MLGAALFSHGFLLTRTELSDVSTCVDVPVESPACVRVAACDECWTPSVTKAVVLVVDGLRWDVARGAARSAAPHRRLALPSLQNLTSSTRGGRRAVLARFVADPPTTTQQRLKGLLTGAPALPALVLGSNACCNS